jgi:hypothetical protein
MNRIKTKDGAEIYYKAWERRVKQTGDRIAPDK